MAGDIIAQLPQLEALCERLYTSQARAIVASSCHAPSKALMHRTALPSGPSASYSAPLVLHTPCSTTRLTRHRPPVQDPAERSQAEQYLRVFSLSTEYVSHCKVRQPRGRVRSAAVLRCMCPVVRLMHHWCKRWAACSERRGSHCVAGAAGQIAVAVCPAPGVLQPHESCD